MLGLAFIGIIVVFSFAVSAAYTYVTKIFRNKKVGAKTEPTDTSRIYYVKNSAPQKRKKPTKRPAIPIKGAVIERSPDGLNL